MIGNKKRGLGKGLGDLGLNELLSDLNTLQHPEENTKDLRKLPVEALQPGKYQPRREMDPNALEELANSIRSQGIIQPIIVRSISSNRYEIIAGERRWRAAQLAALADVPVVIRNISDEAAIAMALIENIQREDLNPIEEATALHRLITEFDMTHEQAADVVGKARVTVTNLLRLLNLNSDVKMLLERNQLELGHAKVLLALTGLAQSEIAKMIVTKKLSVREAEIVIHNYQNKKTAAPKAAVDPNILSLQSNLSERLGAAVQIQHQANGKGQLIIRYNSSDELEGILDHIK